MAESKWPQKDTLVDLLMKKGELCLLQKDLIGLSFFAAANHLSPENPDYLYKQGVALVRYANCTKNNQGLKFACKLFQKTVSLRPLFFDAWYGWGKALHKMGVHQKDTQLLSRAEQKYAQALTLIKGQKKEVLFRLYKHYGEVWVALGKKSGEPGDLSFALDAYKKAASHATSLSPSFWNQYGDIALELGKKSSSLSLLADAMCCYKESVSLHPFSPVSWEKLGKALFELYLLTFDDDQYTQGTDCFAMAAKLHPRSKSLWKEWGNYCMLSGMILQDTKLLQTAVEKCERARTLSPSSVQSLALLIEALARLGETKGDIGLIGEATQKFGQLKLLRVSHEQMLYLEGVIAQAKGAYFADPDYFYQAAEKFQELLSLDRTQSFLWYSLGQAFFKAREIDGDPKSLEYSCRFFKKALHLSPKPHYRYSYALSLIHMAETEQDETLLFEGISHLECAISMQERAKYTHPHWLFTYAEALTFMGDRKECELHYEKAIETCQYLLSLVPHFPNLHWQLATIYSHYGLLAEERDFYKEAFHHYQIESQKNRENDDLLLEWGVSLAQCGNYCIQCNRQKKHYFEKAACKIIEAIKLGNVYGYYSLGALYSLMNEPKLALQFLNKANTFEGLPSMDEILEDEWLDNIRETPDFFLFLKQVEAND